MLDAYPVIVGIDWADKQHDLHVYDTDRQEGQEDTVNNTPGDVIRWLHELKSTFEADRILVCMEDNDTRLYHTLMWHSFVDLVEFNTDTLDHFRETFTPSGAKDDPTDARLQVELLLTHPTQFDIVKPNKESTRNLNNLARKRRNLVDKRGDLENSLRDELKKVLSPGPGTDRLQSAYENDLCISPTMGIPPGTKANRSPGGSGFLP